jgi:hypothetical protein
MSQPAASQRSEGLIGAAAVFMVLCCAVGPAVLGAAAGGLIGGWLGIVCAVTVAAGIAVLVHRRRGKRRC